jgi:hypothetical protein
MSVAETWGTDAAERTLPFPCDRYLDQPDGVYFRGVTIRASARAVFRWLCQIRVAPYSYDWIDNGGRRSPRSLTPGMDALAIGQSMMRIFSLVDFAPNRQVTLRIKHGSGAFRALGDLVVTYLIVPLEDERCRLLVKMAVRYPRGLWGALMRFALPWGDLVMMRRRLLNFKALAEGSSRL